MYGRPNSRNARSYLTSYSGKKLIKDTAMEPSMSNQLQSDSDHTDSMAFPIRSPSKV